MPWAGVDNLAIRQPRCLDGVAVNLNILNLRLSTHGEDFHLEFWFEASALAQIFAQS